MVKSRLKSRVVWNEGIYRVVRTKHKVLAVEIRSGTDALGKANWKVVTDNNELARIYEKAFRNEMRKRKVVV